MNRYIMFAIAFVIALAGPVSAGTYYRYLSPASPSPKAAAGIVLENGQIRRGAGFTVQHLEACRYDIRFDPGFFPTGCASLVVEPFAYFPHNETVSDVTVKGCAAQNPVFRIHFHRPAGIPLDKAFQFVVVGV
jgi:hypothetical protein